MTLTDDSFLNYDFRKFSAAVITSQVIKKPWITTGQLCRTAKKDPREFEENFTFPSDEA